MQRRQLRRGNKVQYGGILGGISLALNQGNKKKYNKLGKKVNNLEKEVNNLKKEVNNLKKK